MGSRTKGSGESTPPPYTNPNRGPNPHRNYHPTPNPYATHPRPRARQALGQRGGPEPAPRVRDRGHRGPPRWGTPEGAVLVNLPPHPGGVLGFGVVAGRMGGILACMWLHWENAFTWVG